MITLSKLDKHLSGFRDWMQEKKYSKQATDKYSNQMKRILVSEPWADKFTYQQVTGFFEKLISFKYPYRRDLLLSLKCYYRYLVETGQRNDHPCRGLNLKGRADRSVIHADLFSMQELEPIAQHQTRGKRIRTCFQSVMSLLVYQGLTVTEIERLKLSSVDLDKGTIRVMGGQMLTSRTLELKPSQFSVLYTYINKDRKRLSKTKSDSLFFSLHGTEMQQDNIRNHIESFRLMYPERTLNARTIRDSVISYWLNDLRIPLDQVQLLAGHRWLVSTERYLKNADIEDRYMLKAVHPLG
jgi:integrase/recombinase XerD